MTALDDIFALLDDADEQLAMAAKMHDRALTKPIARGPFKARIKNILEAERSCLDYLAVEITTRYGSPHKMGRTYYPLAQQPSEFRPLIDSNMPGVAAAVPGVAATIERFQPYQTSGYWLKELSKLTREQKHNRLTTQIVRQIYQCEVVEKATGASVRWYGLRFEPGAIHSDGGAISFDGTGDRDPNVPQPFEIEGPTGFQVFGVPVDPETQRPYPTSALEVTSGPIERWCFTDPHVPIILSLQSYQHGVRKAVTEIAQAARL